MLFLKEIEEFVRDAKTASVKKRFNFAEAKQIGDSLGIHWSEFDVGQFTMGMNIELEHGRRDLATNVTYDEPITTGKIALAHLNEIPDYYTRLAVMEQEAEREKSKPRREDLGEMYTTERNTLLIILFAVIFIVMFALEVR